jgi:hypothetical protein
MPTTAVLTGDVTGGVTVDARQIVRMPAGQTRPFQSDLWGPNYQPA